MSSLSEVNGVQSFWARLWGQSPRLNLSFCHSPMCVLESVSFLSFSPIGLVLKGLLCRWDNTQRKVLVWVPGTGSLMGTSSLKVLRTKSSLKVLLLQKVATSWLRKGSPKAFFSRIPQTGQPTVPSTGRYERMKDELLFGELISRRKRSTVSHNTECLLCTLLRVKTKLVSAPPFTMCVNLGKRLKHRLSVSVSPFVIWG